MSDAKQSPLQPIESRRVPLEREVVLEFEHFAKFIREYSANISLGGMFIKSDRPSLPDTVFRFEVRLVEEGPVIAGLAKVLWVRESAEGKDRPAGMGVRFLQLEDRGRSLIEQIVREFAARGGQPFRLEESPEVVANGKEKTRPQPPAKPPTDPPPTPAPAQVPLDRSTVIDLPALEDLLEEARTPTGTLNMPTPPRGWKPGASVARPQTRPQLIATVAIGAAILGGLIFLGVRMFATQPVVEESDVERPELPRAEAAEGAEPVLPPFTALEEVTWQRAGNGAEIVVRLDGSLPEGSWSVVRVSDPPRHLLKLLGATRPYPTETLEVGFGGVRQLRTGFHDGGAGNEQHVVIDLVDPRVVLEETVVEGDTVRLRFRRLS